jgi:hypothetical protein
MIGLEIPNGPLILKRASASRSFGEWNDEDFDVVSDGVVVGRIFHAAAAPVGSRWMWALAFGHHEDRAPTHGYAETREAAMSAFAKSWRRELTPAAAEPSRRPPLTVDSEHFRSAPRTCRSLGGKLKMR